MKNDIKDKDAYKTIGETAKELNLIDKKTGKIQTYIIRYWESQFKQIKPSIRAGRRRYYSKGNIQLINYIKCFYRWISFYFIKDLNLSHCF